MGEIAIRGENLGKKYRIGERQASYKTFRESLVRMAATPIRWLRGSRKESKSFWALQDVSFTVRQGEVLGIIGRNGAGKSTLLKILSRVTKPTTGRAQLYGRVGSLLEIGTGFHPELTGRENIYLNGTILGMKRQEIRRNFDEIVDFSGIEAFLDTPVKYYSSGMYVRLAFAVAAHLESEILLVDEVLAVGDASFQKKCLGKMKDIAQDGRTVLFVSHNMAAIRALCQRVLLLRDGRVRASGKPDDVIAHYLAADVPAQSDVDLRAHPNRRHGMRPVIERFRVWSDRSEGSNLFSIGEDICFDITLDPNGTQFTHPAVSIAILNSFGGQIVKLASWAQAPDWKVVNGRVTVRCVWPDCRLAPGRYFLNVGFGSGLETVDYVEQVISIEVTAATDEYPTGRIPPGVFLPRVIWQIEGA